MVCITRQKYIPIIIGSFPYSILVFFIHLYSLLKKFDYSKVTVYLANLATDKKKCLVGIFVLNDLKKSNIFNNTFNIFRNREITTHFALQPEQNFHFIHISLTKFSTMIFSCCNIGNLTMNCKFFLLFEQIFTSI